MDDDFDMNDNTIFNLNEPVNDKDAANKKFVVDYVNQDKIQQSVSRKNVFSFVLNQSLWKTEFKTRNLSLLHHINLHIITFEINREVKPGTNGSVYWYRGRVSVDCGSLAYDEYTVVCELFPHWNINTQLNVLSTSINIKKTNKQKFHRLQ